MPTKTAKEDKRHSNRKKMAAWAPWTVAGVLAVLLIVAWWSPITNALSDLFGWIGGTTTASSTPGEQTAERTSSVTVTSTPGAGQGIDTSKTVSVETPTTTVTTSNTTNTTGNSSNSGTTGSTGGSDTATGSLANFYAGVSTGQSENQLISLAGGAPDNCTTVDVAILGTQQVCTWADNSGSVVVTLLNGQVIAKQRVAL